MHEVLVNRLGSLSLPRKSVVRLTDRPDMTLDVYRGRKTTMQQQQCGLLTTLTSSFFLFLFLFLFFIFFFFFFLIAVFLNISAFSIKCPCFMLSLKIQIYFSSNIAVVFFFFFFFFFSALTFYAGLLYNICSSQIQGLWVQMGSSSSEDENRFGRPLARCHQ